MTESPNPSTTMKLNLPTAKSVMLLAAAIVILVGALVFSEHSETSTNPSFTELSLLPLPLNSGNSAEAARVAVENVSGSPVDVVLRVDQGTTLLFQQVLLHLSPGRTWARSFERDNRLQLTATISFVSNPHKTVRTAYLDSRSSS